ncbi:MAG TPA: hypothetical protein V6D10_11090 [Trichocoleus sp.]
MNHPTLLQIWSQPIDSPTIDSSTLQQTLRETALQLQAHFVQEEGEVYRTEDLQQALSRWLELSLESLLEDAMFHVVEGDRAYAFNRRAFELQMKQLQPVQPSAPSQTIAA